MYLLLFKYIFWKIVKHNIFLGAFLLHVWNKNVPIILKHYTCFLSVEFCCLFSKLKITGLAMNPFVLGQILSCVNIFREFQIKIQTNVIDMTIFRKSRVKRTKSLNITTYWWRYSTFQFSITHFKKIVFILIFLRFLTISASKCYTMNHFIQNTK